MSRDIGIRFLDLFQDSKSLGKDALKFAKTFSIGVKHNDVTTVGTREDYFRVGMILAEYGQSIKDFGSENDALEAVRHLCAKNRAEHHYEEKPGPLDEKYTSFSHFWFVMSMGKTQEHKQTVSKNLEQKVDLKNLAQFEEAKLFTEGVGLNTERSASSVQVEHTKADGLDKKNELLKQPYLDRFLLRN